MDTALLKKLNSDPMTPLDVLIKNKFNNFQVSVENKLNEQMTNFNKVLSEENGIFRFGKSYKAELRAGTGNDVSHGQHGVSIPAYQTILEINDFECVAFLLTASTISYYTANSTETKYWQRMMPFHIYFGENVVAVPYMTPIPYNDSTATTAGISSYNTTYPRSILFAELSGSDSTIFGHPAPISEDTVRPQTSQLMSEFFRNTERYYYQYVYPFGTRTTNNGSYIQHLYPTKGIIKTPSLKIKNVYAGWAMLIKLQLDTIVLT